MKRKTSKAVAVGGVVVALISILACVCSLFIPYHITEHQDQLFECVTAIEVVAADLAFLIGIVAVIMNWRANPLRLLSFVALLLAAIAILLTCLIPPII